MNTVDAVQHQDTPRVSVVIPVFNGGPDLERCLAAVAKSTYPVFECILVDDVSTDQAIAPAARLHGARVITMERQSGPGLARNRGAAEARGDVLFFVDADVLLHPDALSIAVRRMQNDPGLSAVFGSYDDQPGNTSFLSQYRNLFHHWVHQTGAENASTFWAGCGAIRRDVFLDMGGFSEDYGRPSIEDIELGGRMRRRGHRIRLDKDMLGKHLKRWRFWNLVRTDIFSRGVPWMRLVLREKNAPKDLNLGSQSRIATLLAAVLGLTVLALPLAGHPAALLPAAAFLLGAVISVLFSGPRLQPGFGTAVTLSLVLTAPIAASRLAPDPWAWLPMALILGVAVTHFAFYRYLAVKRNGAFAIAVIPMQVLFFMGCALAAVIGLSRYLIETRRGAHEDSN